VVENRVLGKIIGPKRDVVMVAEETPSQGAYNMYSSPTTSLVINQEEIGRAHGTYGRQEHLLTGVWEVDFRVRTTWKT